MSVKQNQHPLITPPTHVFPPAKEPILFFQITVDFTTDLPPLKGYDAPMVVVDHELTKGVILVPCHKTTDTSQAAKLFVKHVFVHFGIPNVLISD